VQYTLATIHTSTTLSTSPTLILS